MDGQAKQIDASGVCAAKQAEVENLSPASYFTPFPHSTQPHTELLNLAIVTEDREQPITCVVTKWRLGLL